MSGVDLNSVGGREEAGLLVLEALYKAYDRLAAYRGDLACEKGCGVCCTDRVLLTSLEAAYLLRGLKERGEHGLLLEALECGKGNITLPAATFNQAAATLLKGGDPPEEPQPELTGSCTFLRDGLCKVYDYRPLACRTMASREKCQKGGSALEAPWWVTLNTAFFHIVEAASIGGEFGPLPLVLASVNGREIEGLLQCRELYGLPAPEEHRERLEKELNNVFLTTVEGEPLGVWLNELRECRASGSE